LQFGGRRAAPHPNATIRKNESPGSNATRFFGSLRSDVGPAFAGPPAELIGVHVASLAWQTGVAASMPPLKSRVLRPSVPRRDARSTAAPQELKKVRRGCDQRLFVVE